MTKMFVKVHLASPGLLTSRTKPKLISILRGFFPFAHPPLYIAMTSKPILWSGTVLQYLIQCSSTLHNTPVHLLSTPIPGTLLQHLVHSSIFQYLVQLSSNQYSPPVPGTVLQYLVQSSSIWYSTLVPGTVLQYLVQSSSIWYSTQLPGQYFSTWYSTQ